MAFRNHHQHKRSSSSSTNLKACDIKLMAVKSHSSRVESTLEKWQKLLSREESKAIANLLLLLLPLACLFFSISTIIVIR